MADVATAGEGVEAADLGADLIATTLAGYTSYSLRRTGPAAVEEVESRYAEKGY